MATQTNGQQIPALEDASRRWREFAFKGFARIVARKHGIVVPEFELESLSDEEFEQRLRLVTELAHLPPA